MKKMVILYLALSFFIFPFESIASDQTGFLNIQWGESSESCIEKGICKNSFTDFDKTWFFVDPINLTEIEPTMIILGFKNNQFCSVIISFKGRETYNFLKNFLNETYGYETEGYNYYSSFSTKVSSKHIWKNKGTETSLKYDYENKQSGTLVINHESINKQLSENYRVLQRKFLGPVIT